MDVALIVLIVALVVGAIVGGIMLHLHYEKKRTEALQAVAEGMNFTFAKTGDKSLLASLSEVHLFSQGHARKIKNVMNGHTKAIDVTVMDYRYTTGHGKNSHTWSQTVIIFQTAELELPSFSLRPENVFHRIGSIFGYQDIDFDSHPSFSKSYLLRGEDEDAVRRVFSTGLLDYFAEHRGLHTEGQGERLVFYRSSKRVKPDEIKAFMEEGFSIFGLITA